MINGPGRREEQMNTKLDSQIPATETEEQDKDFWWGILLFRLVLLGFIGSLALVAGGYLGMFYPETNAKKPVVVRIWQWLETLLPEKNVTEKEAIIPNLISTTSNNDLTGGEREQLEAEIEGLQAEINSFTARLSQLERNLGIQPGEDSLELRVKALGLQLEAVAQAGDNHSTRTKEKAKITLPGDLLFPKNNSNLFPEAGTILEAIATELAQYENSTVRIAAYVDAGDKPARSQELSFRRAKVIEHYLSKTLNGNYRWVALGYGQNRSLFPNDTEANRQRNRRIEIAVY